MKLLLHKGLINYDKLYIFAKSLYQPEYRVIQAGFENKLSKSNMLKLLNAGEEIRVKNTGSSILQMISQPLNLLH